MALQVLFPKPLQAADASGRIPISTSFAPPLSTGSLLPTHARQPSLTIWWITCQNYFLCFAGFMDGSLDAPQCAGKERQEGGRWARRGVPTS